MRQNGKSKMCLHFKVKSGPCTGPSPAFDYDHFRVFCESLQGEDPDREAGRVMNRPLFYLTGMNRSNVSCRSNEIPRRPA